MSELKTKWPVEPEETTEHPHINLMRTLAKRERRIDYERARAEAAIERLELLAAELRNIRDMERYDQDGIWHPMTTGTEMSERAGEALLAIGPIPGEQT